MTVAAVFETHKERNPVAMRKPATSSVGEEPTA
jgi:hypothetical protein